MQIVFFVLSIRNLFMAVPLDFFDWFVQSKIIQYMRQMAVITPYAQFLFRYVSATIE
jgi:hypothetical protein